MEGKGLAEVVHLAKEDEEEGGVHSQLSLTSLCSSLQGGEQ